MVASPAYAADALQPTEIANIARETVGRIESTDGDAGSGVIIGRYQREETNVYVVLTSAHVVEYQDEEYTVITPLPEDSANREMNRRQKVVISTERDIQKLKGVDLAVVEFTSDRNYRTARLGDSDYTTEGSGVYIAGFPSPGAAIKRRVFQFTCSLVSSRLDKDLEEG